MLKDKGIVLRNSGENWSWPNLDNIKYHDAIDNAKYGALSKEDANLLTLAISALDHLTNPTYTMKSVVSKLRQIRKFRKGIK